jgi:hypothetical protein
MWISVIILNAIMLLVVAPPEVHAGQVQHRRPLKKFLKNVVRKKAKLATESFFILVLKGKKKKR